MRVKEIMSKAPWICQPTDSLSTAASIMWDRDCGIVPITSDSGKVLGVITDRDICMAGYTKDKCLKEILIEEVMPRTLVKCGPEDSVAQAENLMAEHKLHRLLVVDEAQKLVGLLSLSDIARASVTAGKGILARPKQNTVAQTLARISTPRREPARAH